MLRYCLLVSVVVGHALCQTGLSSTDSQTILNEHNRLRGLVSPTATNMQRMSWNKNLAQVAQNYAQNCVFEHNSNRVSQQSTFTSVGENLFASSGQANYASAVLNWYNEVQDYTYSSNFCSGVCGHYTQVVWATSSSIGCGAYRCANLQGVGANWLIFVCNYGPAGNFVGRQPYTSGSSCSQCSTDRPFCLNNTCSKESSEDKSSKKPTTQDAMAAMFQPTTDGSSVTNLKPTTTVLVFTTFIISILK